MSEGTSQPAPGPDAPAEPARERERGVKRAFVRRWGRRALALVSALVAAFFVTLFSIDLARLPGVDVRGLAERRAKDYLERTTHIGRVSALLTPGDFALDDVVIEGRKPGDRPFMHVGRVTFHVPWWTILKNIRHPDIHVEVRLTDWQMVIESWPGGIHNIPKLTPKNPSTGKKPYTVTVDFAYATGGHFIYEDHGTPWRVDAPNLNFSLVRSIAQQQYVGTAAFNAGAVQILSFRPMATDLTTRFVLDGPKVHLQHIDLTTEGTRSHVNGEIDFTRWPEQVYNVNSTIDFATMREIFFPSETWRLGGVGQFTGIFRYAKDDGLRELMGDFESDDASVYDLGFPDLHGSLVWTNTRFAVTHAESELLGGRTRFEYGLAPLGTPNPATATFAADYSGADLFELDRLMNLHGLRLAGVATGNIALEWQNGQFGATRRGDGHTVVTPPAGAVLAPVSFPSVPIAPAVEPRPFDSNRRSGPLTVGGDIHYRFDPGGVTFEDSWTATPHSFVSYRGRMARDGSSEFPFHVTSHDWQESDRLLTGIMTAVSGPTGAVEVGGRGTFDGVMTGSFSAPRISGHFVGEGLRVWDVTWGHAAADLIIENKYVDITHSLVTGVPGSAIVADGHYSLGFRSDEREEIRSKVRLSNWPLADLRHAFVLDDWPMEGTIGLADLDLRGRYKTMFGTGTLRIDNGHAWKEGFDVATGDLELEGTGLRVSRIEMHKGTGIAHGAARIGWDGTYAFNADGDGIPVEKLDNFQSPSAPLTGRLKFKASGASSFDVPTYTFDGSIDDLFVGDEGIGSVASRLTVTNNIMTFDRLVAASSRLQVLGTGTIALDDAYTSDLRFRFQQTALDPYLKFVMRDDVSPYTRMTVGGSLSVRGPLATPADLQVDATVDDATLTLLDYDLKNDGPVVLHLANGIVRIGAREGEAGPQALTLKGSDTNLTLKGTANTKARTLNLSATGDASLSILQLFPAFKTLTTSGATRVNAALSGSFDAPRLTGEAMITDGRLRPFGSPHSLEAINGRLVIGEKAITLDGLHGRIGSGTVDFGGNIVLDGFAPSEFNLTASGQSMRLRYPEGFDSTVDMNLLLTGPPAAPTLSGRVDVVKMRLRAQSQTSLFAFCGFDMGALVAPSEVASALGPSASSVTPVALALEVHAPRMAFVDTKNARVEATADLRINGTFDQPLIDGDIGLVGGELLCNGNRYFVREGSIRLLPTGKFEPIFDLSAETRPRLGGETYTVDLQVTGTYSSVQLKLSSDPFLPETDLFSLIMGGTVDPTNAEQRALGAAQAQQQRMIQSAGATLLASPLTSLVGSIVERTGALDTVQITPVLPSDTTLQQISPSARVTLGKRISPRVFLTYSRTLSGPQDELILLEYEQSDRVSWLLSRNEDHTFTLDFRIRYAF